jgi:hypothetical protein
MPVSYAIRKACPSCGKSMKAVPQEIADGKLRYVCTACGDDPLHAPAARCARRRNRRFFRDPLRSCADRPQPGFAPMRILTAFVFVVCLFTSPASAATCSEAIAHCKQEGSRHPDAESKCAAAGQACMKGGVFIGPYTRKAWRGLVKQ